MENLMAVMASLLLLSSLSAQTLNVSEAEIHWKGSKSYEYHEGTLNISSGSLTFKNDVLVGGNFTVDMNSILCTDLPEKDAAKLVRNLKSNNFFAVAKHPEANLTFTSITVTDGGYEVTGDFTIRGITNSEIFMLQIEDNKATADLKIDRSKYNIKFASGSFFKQVNTYYRLSKNLFFEEFFTY
jgi:polyisoprenoid-binding protein YceI